MGLFNNEKSKQEKLKKRMDSYEEQMKELKFKRDQAKKELDSLVEEETERITPKKAEDLKAEENNAHESLLKQLAEKDAKISDYERRIADYEAQVADLTAKLNGQNPKQPESQPKPQPEPQTGKMLNVLDAIKVNMDKLTAQICDEHQRLLKENSDLQESLDQKQERLEQIMQTTQEDRYKKDKIKLVNKYIYQMDLIRKVLYDFDSLRTVQSDKESVVFLENQLKSIVVSMEATLAQEMVEPIQYGEQGGNVNPEMQETIDTVATDNPELDGKIYSSINPGYVWTLPYILKAKITDKGDEIKSYRFLVRPEQIVIYRLNK